MREIFQFLNWEEISKPKNNEYNLKWSQKQHFFFQVQIHYTLKRKAKKLEIYVEKEDHIFAMNSNNCKKEVHQ